MYTSLRLRIQPLLRRYNIFGRFGIKKAVVYRCDGTSFHGGLCDRFKGIVVSYAFAKATKRPFKILYNFPFQLTDFLEPRQTDWVPKNGDVCTSIFGVALRRIVGCKTLEPLKEIEDSWRQIHLYAGSNEEILVAINIEWGQTYSFGKLFAELFKPSVELQERLQDVQKEIGGEYIGIHLRFQSLLGDFDEYEYSSTKRKSVRASYPTLEEKEQNKLIEKCVSKTGDIKASERSKKILVLSDSQKFLKVAERCEDVMVYPSRSIHIDARRPDATHEDYLKVFQDFFALAKATKIYSLVTNEMYTSDFPRVASMVNDVPFERVSF